MTEEAKSYKTYFDISKLVVWADAVNGGKRPRLAFSFRDGNPRLVVYTGESGPGSVLTFPSDLLTFGVLLETILKLTDAENGVKFPIESLTPVYEDNKPTDQNRVMATVYAGKSKEGLIYISVIMEGKPKLVFALKPSNFHRFYGEDKNLLPDPEVSKLMAIGLVKQLYGILSSVAVQYTNEEYTLGPRKAASIKGFGAPEPTKTGSKVTNDVINDLDDLEL